MEFILEPESTGNIVEAWSAVRLPFEPKDKLLEMRNSLSIAIRQIKPSANAGLYALYTSAETGFFDVENALLYNVGTGAFSSICKNSLCFERRISSIPESPLFKQEMHHYYCYSMVPSTEQPRFWEKDKVLARWSNLKFNALRSGTKPHTVWHAVKNGTVEVFEKIKQDTFLGLNIIIKSPKGQKTNLAAVIKPILDGIISAFHEQDGFPDRVSITRLSTLLDEPPCEVEKMLCDSRTAVLGKRKLVHPFRKGIQWNPADDLCMAVKVTLEDSLIYGGWQMEGEIFTVAEQNVR